MRNSCLCLLFALIFAIFPLEGIPNPLNQPWDVKSCTVFVQKPDGTSTEETFVPKDTTVEACFKWGWTSTTHPKNCPDWKENVRSACKAAFEKGAAQSRWSAFFKNLMDSQEQRIRFEGCIERYTPSGIMQPVDWSIKKIADALGSDAYRTCTTTPDTLAEPKPAKAPDAAKLQETVKHIDNLEDQPSQFYLNKPKLAISNSTSNLEILSR